METRTSIKLLLMLFFASTNASGQPIERVIVEEVFSDARVSSSVTTAGVEEVYLSLTKEFRPDIKDDTAIQHVIRNGISFAKYLTTDDADFILFESAPLMLTGIKSYNFPVVGISQFDVVDDLASVVFYTTTLTERKVSNFSYIKCTCVLQRINGDWKVIDVKIKRSRFVRLI